MPYWLDVTSVRPVRPEHHIHLVVDVSDSMHEVRKEAIHAFNEYLRSQRRTGVRARVSLTLFNSVVMPVWTGMPLSRVPDLGSDLYQPDGMTALRDAVGLSIRRAERAFRPDDGTHVFVVLTDGEENDSRHVDHDELHRQVAEMHARGCRFVFIGIGIDARDGAMRLGGEPMCQCVIEHARTGTGMYRAMTSASESTTQILRRGEARNTVVHGIDPLVPGTKPPTRKFRRRPPSGRLDHTLYPE